MARLKTSGFNPLQAMLAVRWVLLLLSGITIKTALAQSTTKMT